jgi:hypothetical protein
LWIKQLASLENLDHMGPASASCNPSRSSHAVACFYYLIFTDKIRWSHQQEFLSNPTYRKFSGDCAWNPNQVVSKRFCKKQQMQWTKRAAHLLLQMRVKTLNDELATVFRRWSPDFPVQQSEAQAA